MTSKSENPSSTSNAPPNGPDPWSALDTEVTHVTFGWVPAGQHCGVSERTPWGSAAGLSVAVAVQG
jgi:hypothetical protein